MLVELGDDLVGRIDVDFLSYDSPVAKLSAPTAALTEEKRAWGYPRGSLVGSDARKSRDHVSR